MENVSKKITAILGTILIAGMCVFGTLFLLNKINFALFPGLVNKPSITASAITSTKRQQCNPILKHYQPIQLTIENTGNKEYELRSEDISLPYHSLNEVSRKLSTKLKFFLVSMFGVTLFMDPIANLIPFESNMLIALPAVTLAASMAILLPIVVAGSFISTLQKIKHYKIKNKIKKTILEPGQIITIPPRSTTTKILFCPRKEFLEHFEVTMKEKETGKQNTVQLSLDLTL